MQRFGGKWLDSGGKRSEMWGECVGGNDQDPQLNLCGNPGVKTKSTGCFNSLSTFTTFSPNFCIHGTTVKGLKARKPMPFTTPHMGGAVSVRFLSIE